MIKSNYYNKIAGIYDQTRWMNEYVAEEVADLILKLVDADLETSFLEPGIGTGLNMLPIIKRGYPVTGIDISQEMLNQLHQKLADIPSNLNLIQADASQLPFPNASFDVVLTVHMIHTVANWKIFLDEIDRVLKPGGFYLNAQWITPPARREFENNFRDILSQYSDSKDRDLVIKNINVEEYFGNKNYESNYLVAKKWTVSNTVEELLSFFKSRAYGFCWQVSDGQFNLALRQFEDFCDAHYGSLKTELSSEAKFEIWAYSQNLK